MRDTYFEIALYEIYHIDTNEYSGVSVKTLGFSTRTSNRFSRYGIKTVSDLLKYTPSDLMNMNGFGKSCLDEIERFCESLTTVKNGTLSKKNITKQLFADRRDDIALGDFSAFRGLPLSQNETILLQKYEEAYDVLGNELVFECIINPENIFPIIQMFAKYCNQIKKHTGIQKLVDSLPNGRKNNKALGYINAFTLDENERDILKSLCDSEESTLSSLAFTDSIGNTQIYLLLKRFLEWCNFDLEQEINDLFDALYANERIRLVTQLRVKKQTLEQIGGILGVTRERVRQIEAKAKRMFSRLQNRIRIVSKIAAERNGDTVLTPIEIQEYCGEHTADLLFFLQSYDSANYTYDSQLDAFILGDDSIAERVQSCLEKLPEIIKESMLNDTLYEAAEEADIPLEILEKAFVDVYHLTGELYHRFRLSLTAIYERVLDTHYKHGFKAYDADELRRFREIITEEYGDVGLPLNDRALTTRVASICVLCGRGVYRPKKKEYIPVKLANKICNYIETSDNSIFLTNTIFSVFENELLKYGIDNKYYLQGVLHELFADKFVFRRDYISKDVDITSVYSAVIAFIKKSDSPVSKAQIQAEIPGITEVVINFSVEDPDILNFFGEYLHSSKLNISEYEKSYLFNIIDDLLSDDKAHHVKDAYETIMREKSEILTRNAILHPFSAYSLLEYLFRDKYQFSRPYMAKFGITIERSTKRLHDFVYSLDEIALSDVREFFREHRFNFTSLLSYVNSCNDEFLLINDNAMMKIDRIGINEAIARQVEDIISEAISETTPIRNLSIWAKFPTLNVPWTEWLIYSIILKWGSKLIASVSSNDLRLSVPLVAPIDNYDPTAFKDIDKGDSVCSFVADDLSDMDSLLEDIMDDDFLDNFEV